jgi:hypothetical protein
MNQTTGTSGPAPTATFHARVASVGLVTTLVVLIAACLTFMLQQWAVARTQSHQMHVGLDEPVAIKCLKLQTQLGSAVVAGSGSTRGTLRFARTWR